jgi:ribosomal protein S12 methylthiotransferase accessory factor
VPITRVVDVTPLDFLQLPIWAAVTPLAKDLTTHAGKGLTPRAARLSAVMEAIERVCGEALPSSARVRLASFDVLRAAREGAVVDPEDCELPLRCGYDRSRPYSWTAGFDLLHQEAVWAPVDLVVSPGAEVLRPGPYTNGLASGNTYTEATLHALYEVLERDAIAEHEFQDEFGEAGDIDAPAARMIDPATLPTEARAWTDRLVGAGMRVHVAELKNEFSLPVFAVAIVDPAYPTPEGHVESRFDGSGADLEPRRALLRAITEAVQSRTIAVQGARDTFEGGQEIEQRPWTLRRLLDVTHPHELHTFDGDASASSGDLLADLKDLCGRIAGAGFERCIVFDLARADLEVPAVRVLVPGMSGPLGCGNRPTWRQLRRLL